MVDEIKEELVLGYTEFSQWKEDSDKLFGPVEAVKVWKMIGEFLPPPEEDLIVLGVSENIPTHLVAIWERAIAERDGRVDFLVGDIGRFPVESLIKNKVTPRLNDRHRFQVFQWDAENLPVKPGSVDVIFDRAGWLWHCIKEYEDETRLMNTLISYYGLLKDKGIVVIDTIEGFDDYLESLPKEKRAVYEQKTNSRDKYYRPAERLENPPGQYQPSTVDIITDRTSEDFWFYIGRFFDIEDIGEGVTRVRVLKKKVESQKQTKGVGRVGHQAAIIAWLGGLSNKKRV